jgi:hypothetical protein
MFMNAYLVLFVGTPLFKRFEVLFQRMVLNKPSPMPLAGVRKKKMLTPKANPKRLLVSTVLIVLLCAPFVSAALAEDSRTPASDDSAVATTDGEPVLIQQRDANATNDNSTAPTDAQAEDEGNLIATNTAPDNTALVAGAAAAALAIAVGACVAVVRLRKK